MRLLICALALSLATPAAAQILSPGALGRAHEKLEGLGNCTECHPVGEKVDGKLCLNCHSEVAQAIRRRRGLHATVEEKNEPCFSCHKEHRGRNAALTEWPGTRAAFDHARAGWPLTGKHARARCADCHRPERVNDPKLRQRLSRQAESTYLGLETRCTTCHFDEHRGQLKGSCDSCHTTTAFAPATGFDHRKAWALRGAHAKAQCVDCHPLTDDPERHGDPAPRLPQFARYAVGKPKSCTTCHRDVHAGKFGRDCTTCHDEISWHRIRGSADVSFHDKTRFPLRGLHRSAPCTRCHEERRDKSLVTKGLRFAACTDCHLDAHFGQLTPKDGPLRCERCHDEDGFYPPRYALADHQTTRYPLGGAHLLAPCNGCHLPDAKAFRAQMPRDAGDGHDGARLLNFTRFALPELQLDRCVSCHSDPHGGQFSGGARARGCEDCHTVEDFRQSRFDHDRDSTFALDGKHQGVACARCHEDPGGDAAIIYRGTPNRCAACHADIHRGQFGGTDPVATDCARCHVAAGFKPSRFNHDDPSFTRFALDGKHREVACARCHPERGRGKDKTRWYRGVPRRCADCHEDIHARRGERSLTAVAGEGRSCDLCHATAAWQTVTFDHDQTGLPLRGRHASVTCRACHADLGRMKLDQRCGSCHVDPHAGRLGKNCDRCHEATSFRAGLGVSAHGESRFPLYGRHALIPCSECHQARNELSFGGVPTACESCHLDDYRRTAGTAFDHQANGVGTACRGCHNAVNWRQGLLPEHDRCFPLSRGPHRGIACARCHTAPAGVGVSGCDSFTAACTRCHACSTMDRKHRGEENVAGYQCADRKCYECHPNGRGGD